MDIFQLLREAHYQGASDLHISIGSAPVLRVNGQLTSFGESLCRQDETLQMVKQLLSEEQFNDLEKQGEIDLSFELPGISRFRINAYKQRGSFSLAIRTISQVIPEMDSLGLPSIVRHFCKRQQGLFLVTGPTGSGKSTTLASMVHYINTTFSKHIITLEDPIEHLHQHKRGIVDQRQIGTDTSSFATGLRAALRQDPDVILVGEMRDLETISTAIRAAETGHLVLATLHTTDAPQTIERIIDVFPNGQQQQIRSQLASNLLGVLCQRLLPTQDSSSRVAAFEVMINTPAVANLIRQEKIHQVKSMIQTGAQQGMMTMEQSLLILVSQGLITQQMAIEIAPTMPSYLK